MAAAQKCPSIPTTLRELVELLRWYASAGHAVYGTLRSFCGGGEDLAGTNAHISEKQRDAVCQQYGHSPLGYYGGCSAVLLHFSNVGTVFDHTSGGYANNKPFGAAQPSFGEHAHIISGHTSTLARSPVASTTSYECVGANTSTTLNGG